MKKNIKVLEEDEGSQEQVSGSELSEVDIKRQIKGERKPVIDHQMEIVLQSMLTDTSFDDIFIDMKKELKAEAKNSELVQFADGITFEPSKSKKKKFNKLIDSNIKTAMIANGETEKNHLLYLNNKIEEQEKALMEYIKDKQ